MEALQIMPVMAQRRNSNLGEFAEDATVVVEETVKPSITFLDTTEIIGSGMSVKRGFISDSIMTVILSTTTINIIGVGVIVLKRHFDKSKDNK